MADEPTRLSGCEALYEIFKNEKLYNLSIEQLIERPHTMKCDGKRSFCMTASQKENNPSVDDSYGSMINDTLNITMSV